MAYIPVSKRKEVIKKGNYVPVSLRTAENMAQIEQPAQSPWRNIPTATDFRKTQPMSIKPNETTKKSKQNILQSAVSGISKLGSFATKNIEKNINSAVSGINEFSNDQKEYGQLLLKAKSRNKLTDKEKERYKELDKKLTETTGFLAMSMTEPLKNVGPKVVKGIAKELEPLAQEARKYKSAEEFVKAIDDVRYKSVALQGPEAKYKPYKLSKSEGNLLKVIKETKPSEAKTIEEVNSQLTDIWNKANKIEPTYKPVSERKIRKILKEGTVNTNPPIKQVINKTTGVNPTTPKVTKPEDVLLRYGLRKEAKGSTSGLRAGKVLGRAEMLDKLRYSNETVDTIKRYVQDYVKVNLEPKHQGHFMTVVRDAKNEKDIAKAFVRVDNFVAKRNLEKSIVDLKNKVSKISDSSNIDIEYVQKIKDVVADFDLTKRTSATMEKLNATQKYLTEQKALGKEVAMPQRVLEKLQILSKTPKDQLTASQVQGLHDEIDMLSKMGEAKLRVREDLYNFEKGAKTAQLEQSAINVSPKETIKAPVGEKLSFGQKSVNKLREAYNVAQKKNLSLTPMDGVAKVTGMQPLKSTMDVDYSNFLNHELRTIILDERKAIIKKNKLNKQNMERIGTYAIRRQNGGYEKLANNGITQAEADAVVLTPQEMEYYNFVRRVFDEYFPAVKEFMKEVYNKDVGEVENYVSYITDFEKMSDLEIFNRYGTLADDALRTKTVNQGFTKARTGAGTQKVQIDIDQVFLRHTDDVAYMLTMGKDIKMYSEILNDPKMVEKMGETSNLMWKEWLDLMARKGGTDASKRIFALDLVRRNLGVAMFPFKLSSALVQLTSFADGASVVGADKMFSGASKIIFDSDWRKFVMNNFPEIKAAVADDPAFEELGASWLGKTKWAELGMLPIKKLDLLMRSSAAVGAYEKLAKEAGKAVDLLHPDKSIIQQAQKLVRKSQGSSIIKDQPLAISRGGFTGNKSFDKMLFQFQSFMLNRWDLIKDEIWREGIKEKNPKRVINGLFYLIAMAGAMEFGLRKTSDKILSTVTGSKEQEQDFGSEMATNTIQNVPLVGSLMNSVIYGSNPVPVINTGEAVLSGIYSMRNGKAPETKVKGAWKTTANSGLMLGIPGSSQLGDIGKRLFNKGSSKKKTKGLLF